MTRPSRICANPRCAQRFDPASARQLYCTFACGARARSNLCYADRHGLAVAAAPRATGRACSVCGGPLVGRQALYCRERCKNRAYRWGGNERPERAAPKCWAWPAIRRELEGVDQAALPTLALAVYGDASAASLRAMSDTMRQLADRQQRSGRPYYRGGPWVVLVRRGWWALPDRAAASPSAERLARLLRQRPLTVEEAAHEVGVAPRTVYLWLRRIADAGATVERGVAPRWSTPASARWTYRYWIGGSPAAEWAAA